MKNWKILRVKINNTIYRYNKLLENYEIYSVKRLSDGMIFTIGDLCNFRNSNYENRRIITKMWESSEQLRIDFMGVGLHIDMRDLIVIKKHNKF